MSNKGQEGRDFPAAGDNALMFYARREGSHREIFKLATGGHDIHARDDLERTSLILATVSPDVRNVLVLLRNGADIQHKDEGGDTPLHWAVYHGNAATVRLLLKKGADIEERNLKGKTPLCAAREQNDPLVMAIFDDFKSQQMTAAFIKGTAEVLIVRAPLTIKPHIKLKIKPRKPL